jgi:hypothetical protein
MSEKLHTYERQGFGTQMELPGPYGLLIIDLVEGFADPAIFGGGNIPEAIERTQPLLAHAREKGWPVAHSRIVFADDGADRNVFTLKVPSMLTLLEHEHRSAIVPSRLRPRASWWCARPCLQHFSARTWPLGSTLMAYVRCWLSGPSPAVVYAPVWSTP